MRNFYFPITYLQIKTKFIITTAANCYITQEVFKIKKIESQYCTFMANFIDNHWIICVEKATNLFSIKIPKINFDNFSNNLVFKVHLFI